MLDFLVYLIVWTILGGWMWVFSVHWMNLARAFRDKSINKYVCSSTRHQFNLRIQKPSKINLHDIGIIQVQGDFKHS